MLEDMAATDAIDTGAATPTRSTVATFDRGLLLEALVSDIHWTALHVGTIACLLVARVDAKKEWTLKPWRHLLQDNGPIAKLGLMYCAELGISKAAELKCCELYDLVSEAKVRLAPATQYDRAYPPTMLRTLRPLAASWQSLSHKAYDALSSLEPVTKAQLTERYGENGRILGRFLREAIAGTSDRVNAHGEIDPPMLAQRRRTPRVAVEEPCRVGVGGAMVPGMLQNVSLDGLGIQCARPLEVGERISVELADKRTMTATVVWQADGRAGLRLATPLDRNDALMRVRHAG